MGYKHSHSWLTSTLSLQVPTSQTLLSLTRVQRQPNRHRQDRQPTHRWCSPPEAAFRASLLGKITGEPAPGICWTPKHYRKRINIRVGRSTNNIPLWSFCNGTRITPYSGHSIRIFGVWGLDSSVAPIRRVSLHTRSYRILTSLQNVGFGCLVNSLALEALFAVAGVRPTKSPAL